MKKNLNFKKFISNQILNLPTPININYFWNFGSILGLILVTQILTGFFLSLHYKTDRTLAFESVISIIHNINIGWIIRAIHSNGARLFFFCIYTHMARGLYYNSYYNTFTWLSGSLIYLLSIITAFLGYVLPWGQISFWGATVITNLITIIPYIGEFIVIWLWGGFSVNAPTLNRFFGLHFLIPLLIAALIMVHLIFLHEKGSSNPLGTFSTSESKIKFAPYYVWKDILGFLVFFFILKLLTHFYLLIFLDPVNWIKANSLKTPLHIQPEWYFLFAYAILRTFTSKLAGVIALLLSILILFYLPFFSSKSIIINKSFIPLRKILFWIFIRSFLCLTCLGSLPASGIYIFLRQIFTFIYFSSVLTMPYCDIIWTIFLNNKNKN